MTIGLFSFRIDPNADICEKVIAQTSSEDSSRELIARFVISFAAIIRGPIRRPNDAVDIT